MALPRVLLLAVVSALAAAAPAGAASTVTLERGGPLVVGDAAANRIVVSAIAEGSAFAIEDPDGVTAGEGCRQDGPSRATCPRVDEPPVCEGDSCTDQVSSVHVVGLAGDDDVRVGYGPAAEGWPQTSAFVDGGAGDDFVGGTPVVDYELDGGPGDDLVDGAGYNDGLVGGGGHDRLYGGPGYDKLADGDSRRAPDGDVLDGGACGEPACAPAGPAEPGDEEDTVDYDTRRAPVRVDLRTAEPVQGQRGEGDVVRSVEAAIGGSGADRLIAGPARTGLIGGDGADTLVARNGRPGDFVNCDDGIDVAVHDRGDELVDCESACARLAGCPRPRIVVSGIPRCILGPFTLTVRVRGVAGFRRLIARLDDRPLAVRRRRTSRVRIPRRSGPLDLIAVGRNQRRTQVTVELLSCGLAERSAAR